MTTRDVAEVLGVTEQRVRQLLAAGTLRGKKVGTRGDWRVSATSLQRYVAHVSASHAETACKD